MSAPDKATGRRFTVIQLPIITGSSASDPRRSTATLDFQRNGVRIQRIDGREPSYLYDIDNKKASSSALWLSSKKMKQPVFYSKVPGFTLLIF
ncbi:hypothetical protein O9929_02005 [Vibrio lentus]|nr:hypothetical protein [Vibrio lentus]